MRDIPVGKPSSLPVTFDDQYQIRDVYFPHVGQENHSEGFSFRFGVWAQVKSIVRSVRFALRVFDSPKRTKLIAAQPNPKRV